MPNRMHVELKRRCTQYTPSGRERANRESDQLPARQTGAMHREGTADSHVGCGRHNRSSATLLNRFSLPVFPLRNRRECRLTDFRCRRAKQLQQTGERLEMHDCDDCSWTAQQSGNIPPRVASVLTLARRLSRESDQPPSAADRCIGIAKELRTVMSGAHNRSSAALLSNCIPPQPNIFGPLAHVQFARRVGI
jgi:hypothetical protein